MPIRFGTALSAYSPKSKRTIQNFLFARDTPTHGRTPTVAMNPPSPSGHYHRREFPRREENFFDKEITERYNIHQENSTSPRTKKRHKQNRTIGLPPATNSTKRKRPLPMGKGLKKKRKEGDSNPRYPFGYVSLANWWFQPLTHPSKWG